MTYAAPLPRSRHRSDSPRLHRSGRAASSGTASRVRRNPLALRHRGIPEAIAVLGLGLILSVAPPAPPRADAVALPDSGRGVSAPAAVAAQPTFSRSESQNLRVAASVAGDDVRRDSIQATPGERMLIAEGTNASWAKLVMRYAGWPQSDANVTVFLQWMRQENGPDNWWNRNNPLNNGWGSGGGGGFGSYVNLQTGARMAAENLKRPLFSGIAACFAAGNGGCKDAIVASPWAASRYGNGTRWSTRPVDIFRAPAGAWAQ